ncbi:hypothetical protein NE237_006858 [Protea cynaroides]|uniref:Uncharacterized protein n=1 Tax=Protea cynaroides TaxID=273540 RepID=A0A9Q0KNE9_9MAGN|nr:hypothetical protein NE237_006858 [Protea cynaroides]
MAFQYLGYQALKQQRENTCCRLPVVEFLSSNFWRTTDSRYPCSRLSSAGGSLTVFLNVADKDRSSGPLKVDKQRFCLWSGGDVFIVNPLAQIHSDSRSNSEVYSNRHNPWSWGRGGHSGRGLDVVSSVTG